MIASVLTLSRSDIKNLRITDNYSLHRVVYGFYEDVRTEAEKKASVPSGILYADKGGDFNSRSILMLANREPVISNQNQNKIKIKIKKIPEGFLNYKNYAFEVVMNPTKRDSKTGKILPILGREALLKWFVEKAPESWGFSVDSNTLDVHDIHVQSFEKKDQAVLQGSATFKGKLQVLNQDRFEISFKQGVGRGRAFGFGLLQIVPVN